MGNNMIPYTFAIGEKHTYFISTHYKFIGNDKIVEEGTFLNTTSGNLDPFDYHLQKCGENSFKTLEHTQIHSFYLDSEENTQDEDDVLVEEEVEDDDLIARNYPNGTNGVLKIFDEMSVIGYERDSVYAFTQPGHQRICEQCYQNKGDNDISKCVRCRTYFFTILMETINDVLHCLNRLDFTANIIDTDFENLRCVKRILVKEFEDYNISKLFDVLITVDNLFITLTVGELQDISIKTDVLRENVLHLISFKHCVVSNSESEKITSEVDIVLLVIEKTVIQQINLVKMKVFIEYDIYNTEIGEINITVERVIREHNNKYSYNCWYELYEKANIEFFDKFKNNTKNVWVEAKRVTYCAKRK